MEVIAESNTQADEDVPGNETEVADDVIDVDPDQPWLGYRGQVARKAWEDVESDVEVIKVWLDCHLAEALL